MIPTQYLLDTYGLKSPEEYWAQKPGVQYQQRLNLMKNVTYSGDNGNSTGPQPAAQDFSMNKISQSDTYNPNNYYHTGISRVLTMMTGQQSSARLQATALTLTQRTLQLQNML